MKALLALIASIRSGDGVLTTIPREAAVGASDPRRHIGGSRFRRIDVRDKHRLWTLSRLRLNHSTCCT